MAESRKCCKCGRPAPIRWEGTGWIGSLLIDELMCPDCQRPQTHPHITHFDDCGCLSARKDGEIADLHARVSRLEQQLEHAGELLTEEQAYHLETQTALAKVQAENARLRKALEEIEATYRLIDGCKIETRAVVYLHKIQTIFRSALGKPRSMLNDAPVQP